MMVVSTVEINKSNALFLGKAKKKKGFNGYVPSGKKGVINNNPSAINTKRVDFGKYGVWIVPVYLLRYS